MRPDQELRQIYDTVFCMPGMNDKIKLSLQVSRRNILLLTKVIERDIQCKVAGEMKEGVIDVVFKESLEELTGFADDILEKSGLTVLNEKLKAF